MTCRYPWPLKVVRFIENPLLFHRLNISGADISCVLENDVAETARSMQPVTLYITLNIVPPTVYNSPPSIPTADDGSPAEEAPILGTHSIPLPEHPLPPSHHQPVGAGNKPKSRKESPASTKDDELKDLRLALDHAYQDMKRIDRSNTWQGAVGRIKWVMDTLSPVAEVRVIPFDALG
jgi:hypothetical protein